MPSSMVVSIRPVEVTAAREGDRLLLSVLDRGAGGAGSPGGNGCFDVFERVDLSGDATPGVDRIARRGAGLGWRCAV